jgi:hypothetical protein
MSWPNNPTWSAGRNGVTVATERGDFYLWTIPCGSLLVPSGKLSVCDPFAFMRPRDNPHIITPTGKFPVTVTLADVSGNLDRSHIREAYASIHFADGQESYRKTLALAKEGEDRPMTEGDEYIGFAVDAGTACFVDDSVLETCMPDKSTWLADLFENERSDCWFARMDDPNHIRDGIADIPLPLGRNGENLILFHSGWGDGVFPVVGSYDSDHRLLAAHVDFFVIP